LGMQIILERTGRKIRTARQEGKRGWLRPSKRGAVKKVSKRKKTGSAHPGEGVNTETEIQPFYGRGGTMWEKGVIQEGGGSGKMKIHQGRFKTTTFRTHRRS